MKAALIAVPAGAVHLTATKEQRGFRTKNSRNSLVSKAYNVLAARPLTNKMNRLQTYTASLRTDSVAFFSTSAAVPTYYGYVFALSQFADVTAYTALFDQYKIEEFEFWMEPQQSQSVVATNSGLLISKVDIDDANTPATLTSLQAGQSAIETNGQTGHYHKWRPHMAVALYSGTFTSYGNAPAGWIDCASAGVQMYGIKIGATATSSITVYNATIRARVSFRQSGL
jgi:hypothetical protein